MSETLLTIQEASEISGKSIQTIRRAIKGSKLSSKRRKTPQGFNYLVSRDSLFNYYQLQAGLFDREQGGLGKVSPGSNAGAASGANAGAKKSTETKLSPQYATLEELKRLQSEIESVLVEHKKEKESFMRFMKAFQERFVVLENQIKLIEQPGKKRWYQFWK